jgi:hypothetical protein
MKRGSMKRKKSGRQALVAYLCRFRPEPESGFTVTCPKLPRWLPMAKLWKKRRRMRARRSSLEVMREDGQPIPLPDRDLASPIDQLVPVADADA